MTTITKERIELFIKSPLENGLTRGEQMELARIALVSLDAEPVAYIFKHPAGELFWALTDKSNKGQNDVIPVYAVPPASVTGIYDDVLNIIGLLENNEWAEHCTGTVLGSLLESEITRLVSKEQSVPVVPDEMATSDDMNLYQKSFAQGYNACRAAMLQGVEQPQNARQNIPENIPDGNSPAIPDDWVMVPKEPTQAMIKAWLSEVANFRGHAAGYKAALAAAPKPQNVPQNIPENIPSGKSTLTPDGWISCSERMPAQDDWVLIYSKHGEYLAGQVQGEYVELNDGTLSWLGSALHWMLLPEPPQQEVK